MKLEKDKVYQIIQKQLQNVPLLLIGTGGTMPYGISGMSVLAKELISGLSSKYSKDAAWKEFSSRLAKGIDLENALSGLQLSSDISRDIVDITWNLVSRDDINLMHDWIGRDKRPELGEVVNRFYKVNPQCVNIITTNYDRVIEYSCDQFKLPVNTFFAGEYFKHYVEMDVPSRRKVNLLKVHGSLDWFYRDSSQVVSLPLQEKIPDGFRPSIVTPGVEKYERVLKSPFRDMLHIADELISKATGYLCIGYGFNDNQIQENIIGEIRAGKPIAIWTKGLSKNALELIRTASKCFIVVEADEDDESKTRVIFPDSETILNEKIWDMNGLLQVI